MLNDHSLRATEQAVYAGNFRRPLFGSYCFASLPQAVSWLLTGSGEPGFAVDCFGPFRPPFDTVVVFFFDSFGWRFVDRALENCPGFRLLAERGVLSRITAQFPSTTAAHVTTMHTGLPVGQSGVYAWQYYEPKVGAIIEPLPYAYYGQARNTLRLSGVEARELVPRHNLYQKLAGAGVRSVLLQPAGICDSPCNLVFSAGAEVRGHRTFAEALVNLREVVGQARGKTYVHLYHDQLDTVSHFHGPDSEHAAAEVEAVWLQFERLFHDRVRLKRTALLVCADHGQIDIVPERLTYLNLLVPALVPALEKDRLGRPLATCGSKRDLFLHVKESQLEGARESLRKALATKAEVVPTRELIDEGFFGPVGPAFLERVGNLVVLPHAGEGVWWYDPEVHSALKRGHHGGLSPQEMDVPLLVVAFD